MATTTWFSDTVEWSDSSQLKFGTVLSWMFVNRHTFSTRTGF
jgi:hypothetical protein